jgi:hypothetical protein
MAHLVYGKPKVFVKSNSNEKISMSTHTTKICDMTDEQLEQTGFKSKYEVWKHFQQVIPNVFFHDVVTIIGRGVEI